MNIKLTKKSELQLQTNVPKKKSDMYKKVKQVTIESFNSVATKLIPLCPTVPTETTLLT